MSSIMTLVPPSVELENNGLSIPPFTYPPKSEREVALYFLRINCTFRIEDSSFK